MSCTLCSWGRLQYLQSPKIPALPAHWRTRPQTACVAHWLCYYVKTRPAHTFFFFFFLVLAFGIILCALCYVAEEAFLILIWPKRKGTTRDAKPAGQLKAVQSTLYTGPPSTRPSIFRNRELSPVIIRLVMSELIDGRFYMIVCRSMVCAWRTQLT